MSLQVEDFISWLGIEKEIEINTKWDFFNPAKEGATIKIKDDKIIIYLKGVENTKELNYLIFHELSELWLLEKGHPFFIPGWISYNDEKTNLLVESVLTFADVIVYALMVHPYVYEAYKVYGLVDWLKRDLNSTLEETIQLSKFFPLLLKQVPYLNEIFKRDFQISLERLISTCLGIKFEECNYTNSRYFGKAVDYIPYFAPPSFKEARKKARRILKKNYNKIKEGFNFDHEKIKEEFKKHFKDLFLLNIDLIYKPINDYHRYYFLLGKHRLIRNLQKKFYY